MDYRKLFWGFVFLFDFRINGFDIMPDVVGYIFFYQGLTALESRNSYFAKAKSFAFPMIFISIFDIFQFNILNNNVWNSASLISIIIGVAITIINLLMVYNICFGIIEEARKFNLSHLEEKAISRWKLYLVSNILVTCGSFLVMALPPLFIVIFIVGVISYILMLELMNSTSIALGQ